MRPRTPGCPDCGCERDDHDPDNTPNTCNDCGECDTVFDPGDEIDAAMMQADALVGAGTEGNTDA